MTCWQCGLHDNADEHAAAVTEKAARISEGFCVWCSGRLDVLGGRAWHCGFYQRADALGYEVSTW